ncbi:hypothetical protein TraAM80_08934 [Trypanosoma rangeli]|uniref:Transmembrane protein n=1 Tax=Trypanosoma rangeli TaxID=5698 RepID=A0A3R7N0V5_TRYRA|nr:uncharacterized protein TraAM80_08934 [Trypanosoma rangeli]RNE98156.1 hypothetical protein TraAM80_08934 [Trypanosoma rangeli]|eukprot:RNE98156.1 hypothetical protein TraAM80_08934 [Trypanosoma rangeli]
MGLLSNTTIFTLMVLPIFLLTKGHHIEFGRLIVLAAVIASYMIAESTLLASLAGMPLPQHLVTVVVIPVVDILLMNFVLNDSKARKVLRVHDASDDAAAAVAALWTTVELVLYRCFRWYRVISVLGFDAENLVSAAESFVGLNALLLAARRINGLGNNGGSGSSATQNAWVAVLFLRVAMTAVGVVLGSTLVGSILFAAALLLLQLLRPPTHTANSKED